MLALLDTPQTIKLHASMNTSHTSSCSHIIHRCISSPLLAEQKHACTNTPAFLLFLLMPVAQSRQHPTTYQTSHTSDRPAHTADRSVAERVLRVLMLAIDGQT